MSGVMPWEVDSAADLGVINENASDDKMPWELSDIEVSSISQQTPPENYGEMSTLDVAGEAITNFPSSITGVAKDIYTAITNPSDTLYGLGQLVAGTAQKAGLQAVDSLMPKRMEGDVSPQALQGKEDIISWLSGDGKAIKSAEAVSDFYAQRYGSVAGLKEAIAKDPASVMADAATVLSGGASVGTKLGLPAKAADVMTKAASYADPISLAGHTVGALGKATASGSKLITGTATGAGADSISQAYQSGLTGGKSAEAFLGGLRGGEDIKSILSAAKDSLLNMKIAKNAKYKSNQAALKANDIILNFTGIDKAVNKALNTVTHKGKIINEKGHEAVLEAQEFVREWKASDPKEFHTPIDMDKLKQKVQSVVEKQEYGSQARYAVTQIKIGIDKEIRAQAPSYASMMAEYTKQSDLVADVEKAFTMGKTRNVESSIKKLQSTLRNNVNTGFGSKKALAETLDEFGDGTILPMAAGQGLNEWMPRGIQGAALMPSTLGMGYLGGPLLAAGNLIASSPRLMGEVAFKGGQVSRATQGLLGMAPDVNVGQALNLMYQSQQPKEQR